MGRVRPPVKSKKDANHAQIVRWFKQIGWSVADLSDAGRGIPDIVVGGVHPVHGKIDVFVEIKTDTGSLRDNQTEFARQWRGRDVEVARTLDDVLRITGRSQ